MEEDSLLSRFGLQNLSSLFKTIVQLWVQRLCCRMIRLTCASSGDSTRRRVERATTRLEIKSLPVGLFPSHEGFRAVRDCTRSATDYTI